MRGFNDKLVDEEDDDSILVKYASYKNLNTEIFFSFGSMLEY